MVTSCFASVPLPASSGVDTEENERSLLVALEREVESKECD